MADRFFDMICKYQSQRLDEQRASLPSCPSHTPCPAAPVPTCKKSSEDDQLLEMLFKLQQSRLNEQRCEMPSAPHLVSRVNQHCVQPHDDNESDDMSSTEEEEGAEEGEEGGKGGIAEHAAEAEERRDQLLDLIVQPQV